jgi:hypothetical protein
MIKMQNNQNNQNNKNIMETSGISEFKNIFEKIDLTIYDYIYVSMGSKYNNSETITYTIANKTIHKKTNAEWQMIPEFIRNISNQMKTLVICIDRFENNTIKKTNIDVLSHIINNGMYIIICDLDGTIHLFESIIDIITKSAVKYAIPPEKIMIVNFIRFIYPNHTESYLEENLSKSLHKQLLQTAYTDCLYEWFGYQPNLYNIVYKYNAQSLFIILSSVINTLNKNIEHCELTSDNIHILENSTINRRFLGIFLKNTFDIKYKSNEFECLHNILHAFLKK